MSEQTIQLEHGFYLSPIVETDKAAYVEHFKDPSIAKNLLYVPYPYTENDAEFWINMRVKEAKNPETFLAIRNSAGYLIGAIGTGYSAGNMSTSMLTSVEFGYWLAPDYRGKNLMPVVIQHFAKHLFSSFPELHRLQASIFSHNQASAKALQKAGFTEE